MSDAVIVPALSARPRDSVTIEVEPDLPDAECHWRQNAVDHWQRVMRRRVDEIHLLKAAAGTNRGTPEQYFAALGDTTKGVCPSFGPKESPTIGGAAKLLGKEHGFDSASANQQ